VLAQIKEFALRELTGAELIGTMDSPIKGTDGNREFLLGLKKS
jgi:23S rRNA (cytidine1920-2'-O)/16S rRNA (cytidine1409-2'-O)-methyltransferase